MNIYETILIQLVWEKGIRVPDRTCQSGGKDAMEASSGEINMATDSHHTVGNWIILIRRVQRAVESTTALLAE